MEREQIVRDDFPTARKGWDPAAVRAHLESLADRLPKSDVSLADAAAQRVSEIVGAAEAVASGIEEDAEKRAEALVESAREEADSILEQAREEARVRLERAQSAVESLIAGAEDLRSRVGSLGERLTGEGGADDAAAAARAQPEAEPAAVPASPAAAVPGPELIPEPEVEVEPAKAQPAPVAAVPGPELIAEPEVDPEPEPAASSADPEPGPAASEEVSTEELLARLKGDVAEAGQAAEPAPAETADPAEAEASLAGIRLVALNLALEGLDRDAIATRVEDEFGPVDGADAVIDEVVARAAG